MMNKPLFIIAILLIAVRQLSASSATEIIISISDQTLAVVDSGKLIARYRVSTSKFGNGDNVGSFQTPLGTLFISGKFGDHLPAGTVIKNRAPTGEIIAVDAPNRDAIVSRVIWLRGMERQNLAASENLGGKSQSNLPEVHPRFTSSSATPAFDNFTSPPVSSLITSENAGS